MTRGSQLVFRGRGRELVSGLEVDVVGGAALVFIGQSEAHWMIPNFERELLCLCYGVLFK
jgi:hypothetical protein